MHMIPDAAPPAQPTTARFRVEEHIIDAYAGPNDTLLDNPNLLVNATLTSRDDVETSPDRDGGWDIFHALVTNDPYRYRSGGGTRLVLVEDGAR